MIRPATSEDAEAIALLMRELYREEGVRAETQADEIARALFGEKRSVQLAAFVAQVEGEVVAALLYYPGYDTLSAIEGYHLADIIVTKNFRRRGIGKALLLALAQRSLAEGKTWLSLTVLSNNDTARAFYQSLGMQQAAVDFLALGKTGLANL